MTKSQIDRMGDRLKRGNPKEADLRLLDEYRASFAEAYGYVVRVLRDELGLAPTGRQAKTTASVIAKLQREGTKLNRMQDIAGCRLIVEDVAAQDRTVRALTQRFADIRIKDRRDRPSHGYRAVHAIVKSGDRVIEVQIRTRLQQMWAELSEKLSDAVDPAIKYGGGHEVFRQMLNVLSGQASRIESEESELLELHRELTDRRQKLVRALADLTLVYENRGRHAVSD